MSLVKLKKALAITVAALQIPLLMLWAIIVNTLRLSCHRLEASTKPNGDIAYELVFKEEIFRSELPAFLPFFLALAACLVLSVVGLIAVLRKKRVTVTTACLYAVATLICGFLWFAFARPSAIVGYLNSTNLFLIELEYFQRIGGMGLPGTDLLFSFVKSIKFLLLGLCMAASGVLCGLGITEAVQKKKAPPLVTEAVEPELYQVQGRRKTE
ncbi:MAG: hypothetical protein IJ363_07835 [Clostridia bacterium]|nr:hypothetical protein [Clostridia bacterium]